MRKKKKKKKKEKKRKKKGKETLGGYKRYITLIFLLLKIQNLSFFSYIIIL